MAGPGSAVPSAGRDRRLYWPKCSKVLCSLSPSANSVSLVFLHSPCLPFRDIASSLALVALMRYYPGLKARAKALRQTPMSSFLPKLLAKPHGRCVCLTTGGQKSLVWAAEVTRGSSMSHLPLPGATVPWCRMLTLCPLGVAGGAQVSVPFFFRMNAQLYP